MPAQSWSALGTTVSVDETGGGTFTLVGQIKSIKGVGSGEISKRDVTTLSSTLKIGLPTLQEPGEFSFEINADPTDAVHTFLQTQKDSPPAAGDTDWKVTFPDGTTAACTGWVSGLDGIDADGPDDSLTRTVTVTPITVWVFTTPP